MKVFRMAAVLAVLAAPAYAQTMPNINLMDTGPGKTDEEKAAERERDARYKETLKKIPDAKASNDPWGGMRSDPPKAAASPKNSGTSTSAATKKTRSGSTAN
jgi:hypothetical protein